MSVTVGEGRQLLIAERFGVTLQGEGPSAGHPAVFVRLSRCNLACGAADGAAFVCDTPYTWDRTRFDLAAESRRESVEEVAGWVLAHPVNLVVITGGEPLLQQVALVELVTRLADAGRRVEIETNGTITPAPALLERAWCNVSPKLASSGMAERRRVVPAALRALAASGRAVFKFVACDRADVEEVARLAEEFALTPVWIMPQGTDPQTLMIGGRELAEEVIARGWHLTLRLHVLLWGDERGR
ncbi:7-carboxy-7-deazaguanine synthase QueE [Streptosporangium sp. G11]|uniref:7-carboxy-7-deazaguanine synthase QueE n=1 Tax=Streptosporangium sp. G11 TaxID=3436926 RepID=UPI003EB6E48E